MTGLFATKQDLSIREMITRMLGAARFKADTFTELRDNPRATLQSIVLVPLTGLCYGVGLSVFAFLNTGVSSSDAILLILLGLVAACVIALAWSATAFAVVTRLFRRPIGYANLARPFLFSWTPGVLLILLSVPDPVFSETSRVVATGWVAIASIFAVRYSTGLTVQQSMITFILSVFILLFLLILVDSLLPLFFT